jgi:hypothetical protein
MPYVDLSFFRRFLRAGTLLVAAGFLSFSVHAQTDWTKASSLRIAKTEIERLLKYKKDDQVRVVVQPDKNPGQTLNLQVLNNLNQGEQSGAMACRIPLEKGEAKLLISRKLLGGKLVYQISILPQKGLDVSSFRLKEEQKDVFVLVPVDREDIVSE